MKKLITVSLILILMSCQSYVDNIADKKVIYYPFVLENLESHNHIVTRQRISGKSDAERHVRQKFSIDIPKKIVHWEVLGNQHLFEYPCRQIIIIDSGNKKKNRSYNNTWYIIDIEEKEIENYITGYWNDRKYSERKLYKFNKKTTKIYTDGFTKILLYNIKEKNYDNFLLLIKSFKYID